MTTYTSEMIDLSLTMRDLIANRAETESQIRSLVEEMRDAGMTWASIAMALETSSQNAWARYSGIPTHNPSAEQPQLFD